MTTWPKHPSGGLIVDLFFDNKQLKDAGLSVHSSDTELYGSLSCGADEAKKYYRISRNQMGVTFKAKGD